MRTRAGAEGSVEACVAAYLDSLRTLQYAASTYSAAVRMLLRLRLFLHDRRIVRIQRVREADLVSFMRQVSKGRDKPLRPGSQGLYLTRIRAFFAFLERRGWILLNPTRGLRMPSADPLPRDVLTVAQTRRLVLAPDAATTLGKRDRAILELLYGAGIRLGECVRLDLKDLDLARRELWVRQGKGRRDRLVPLGGRAEHALGIYLMESRPKVVGDGHETALFIAFGRVTGQRLARSGVGLMIEKYARRARLPKRVSPHVLRHTCATHLLRGGADIRHVQALLGHQEIATTARYTRVAIHDLQAVIRRSHPREQATCRRRRRA